jgi:PIN domain nuclease of toxin-antitoxin system
VSAYLLDTNTVLIGLSKPDMLPDAVRTALLSGQNTMSVLSYWEVLLKSMKGKVDVGDPRNWWTEALERLSATSLPLRPEHISVVYDLAPIHQDPFDRALIAQAMIEDLTLVTLDAEIPKYASERFRVLT